MFRLCGLPCSLAAVGEGRSDFLDDPVVPFFVECLQQDRATDFWLTLEVLSAKLTLVVRHKRSTHEVPITCGIDLPIVLLKWIHEVSSCLKDLLCCWIPGRDSLSGCRIASGSQLLSSAGGWTLAGTAGISSSIFPLHQGQHGASQRRGAIRVLPS